MTHYKRDLAIGHSHQALRVRRRRRTITMISKYESLKDLDCGGKDSKFLWSPNLIVYKALI